MLVSSVVLVVAGLGCAPKSPPAATAPAASAPEPSTVAEPENAPPTPAGDDFPDPYPNAGEFDSAPETCPDYKVRPVREACERGGYDAVERLMGEAVQKANAAGEDYDCGTCHNLYYRMINADAATRLKPWL